MTPRPTARAEARCQAGRDDHEEGLRVGCGVGFNVFEGLDVEKTGRLSRGRRRSSLFSVLRGAGSAPREATRINALSSHALHVSALIAAGGRGLRFGAAQPKQFLALGGRSILERSVDVFSRKGCSDVIDDLVVAVPPKSSRTPPASLLAGGKPIQIVAGGARRQDSVANAFARVAERRRHRGDSRCRAAVRDRRRDRATVAARPRPAPRSRRSRAHDTVKRASRRSP